MGFSFLNACLIKVFECAFDFSPHIQGTLTSNLPHHHFDGIHPDSQSSVLGDGVGNAAAAVTDLCVKVDPLSRWGLRHDMDVNLQRRDLGEEARTIWNRFSKAFRGSSADIFKRIKSRQKPVLVFR